MGTPGTTATFLGYIAGAADDPDEPIPAALRDFNPASLDEVRALGQKLIDAVDAERRRRAATPPNRAAGLSYEGGPFAPDA